MNPAWIVVVVPAAVVIYACFWAVVLNIVIIPSNKEDK